ncbi:MAG: DUF4124 domain-containing protein [Rhodanobacteraceae bacterium]
MPRLMSAVFAVAALALAASAANAQVYKWKDASGTTHYSDQPPAGAKYEKVQVNSNVSTPVTAPSSAAATADASTAAAKPAPAAGKVTDTPGNRAKLCNDLGSNIALLNSQQPLTIGDSGAQKSISDDERRQQLATAQAQQKQYCAGG